MMDRLESEEPIFSIVVPTYARPERLAKCLSGIAMLDYPRDLFEVIVVDDGSDQPPESIIVQLKDQIDIKLLKQHHAGPAIARNRGAQHSKGRFLAFTDDDCVPLRGWLRALAERLSAEPDSMIGGRTLNALPENPYSTASQLLIDYLYDYYSTDSKRNRFFTSNNFALSAELFLKTGGFDASFSLAAGEDREFCDRWLHNGYRMIYAPEAQVMHAHLLSLYEFCRQHLNYGRGAFTFHRVRSQRGEKRVKLEPLSFYSNLIFYPFNQELGLRSGLLSILLLISQLACLAGFSFEKISQEVD